MTNLRRYSQEFKEEAVKSGTENGYSIAEAARQIIFLIPVSGNGLTK